MFLNYILCISFFIKNPFLTALYIFFVEFNLIKVNTYQAVPLLVVSLTTVHSTQQINYMVIHLNMCNLRDLLIINPLLLALK